MNLFQTGDFTLNSGTKSNFKIECDALTDDDWKGIAALLSKNYQPGAVIGVPTGGVRFAKAMLPYCTGNPNDALLIMDDVMTTGGSMERVKRDVMWPGEIIGIVLFSRKARNSTPQWIHPVFTTGFIVP